ncbi:MAG TPA: alpha/beta fold hydrolase, partial [Thermoanaerobaculia bacterium]|nr:alpha/beta fold hydrolase [Thermoanaerobaculia bacterium]
MADWKPALPAAMVAAPPASARSHPSPASRDLSWLRPCWLPGVQRQAVCGAYPVWENREARAGRRIGIFVTVLSARSPSPKPDPVFYLDGGPGNAASTAAADLATLLDDILEDRDLVLIDQRGTGASNPLACDGLGAGSGSDLFRLAELRECRRKLEQKADLRLYTTPIAMADLDEIRGALGYGRINLLSASYGSAAAQVYLRAYPDRVRSAVLLAAGPVDVRYPLHVARDHQRALNLTFDACAADPACATAFPKLREDFARMTERLAAGPVEVEVPARPATPGRAAAPKETVHLSLDLVRLTLPHRLYSAEAAARVPNSIHRAAQGDFAELARACRSIQRQTWDDPSQGLFLSISCSEDEAALDPAVVERETRGTFVGDIRVRLQTARCAEWPRATLPLGYHEPVRSNVPALLLTGEADPILPPVWAEEVARNLPNSRLIVVPNASHWPVTPCTQKLIRAFLRAGTAQGLDA